MTIQSFSFILACSAPPVGAGLYSAPFRRSTEPRKRISARAGNDPYRSAPLPASGRLLPR